MKNKFIKFLSEHKLDIFIIIALLMYISSDILCRSLNNLDEIWQFNFARNIANGLLPYKEYNMITPPGLPIICGIILKIFGTELICMRIMAVILCTSILYFVYKCLIELEINTTLALLTTWGICYLFKGYFCIDYNFVTLLIALICLYKELKRLKTHELLENNFKYDFLMGILAGSTILIKHTSGFIFSAIFIGYKILVALTSKSDFKKFFKIALIRLAGVIVPIVLLLAYLLFNNIFNDFIEYAILGISEFTNKIPYSNLLKGNLKILAILVPLIIVINSLEIIFDKNKKNTILFAFSISLLIIMYPISDNIHFLISSTIAMIAGIFFIQKYIAMIPVDKLKIKIDEKKKIWIYAFCDALGEIIGFMMIVTAFFSLSEADLEIYTTLSNFKYIPVDYNLEESILAVDKYMEENSDKTIYIVDARAAIYNIPTNKYIKDYDMFLIGNIGKNGTEKIYNEISTRDDLVLLIVNDNVGLNWQTPTRIIDYIKQEYTKTDSISLFDVYVKE